MAGNRRDSKKESFWRRMVEGQAASGLGVRAWCRKQGLREYSFYAWRRELGLRDAACREPGRAEAGQPVFVPVRVAESAPTNGEGWLEIRLAGKRCVRIQGRVDRQTLTDVLAVLASAGAGQPAFGSAAQARREAAVC